jgi:hypothetical protein
MKLMRPPQSDQAVRNTAKKSLLDLSPTCTGPCCRGICEAPVAVEARAAGPEPATEAARDEPGGMLPDTAWPCDAVPGTAPGGTAAGAGWGFAAGAAAPTG